MPTLPLQASQDRPGPTALQDRQGPAASQVCSIPHASHLDYPPALSTMHRGYPDPCSPSAGLTGRNGASGLTGVLHPLPHARASLQPCTSLAHDLMPVTALPPQASLDRREPTTSRVCSIPPASHTDYPLALTTLHRDARMPAFPVQDSQDRPGRAASQV